MNNSLMHYGTPRHSGRYPWGSGERPYQGDGFVKSFIAKQNAKIIAEYKDSYSKLSPKEKAVYKSGYDAYKEKRKKKGKPIKYGTLFEYYMFLQRNRDANRRMLNEQLRQHEQFQQIHMQTVQQMLNQQMLDQQMLDMQTHHNMMYQAGAYGMGMWSDEGGEDFMYVDNLLDRSDELMHYGTPRHSGRYPWGSGERPFQRQGSTRLHNYMSSDKLDSIRKQEEKKILKEAGYSSREEFKDKFLEGMRTGSPVKLTSDDVKVLSELNKLDKEYNKASKKSKRLDKHVDMTMNNMGRFWNFDEYATADARAKRKINDYEKKEGHKLTEDEKQRVLLEEYRKIKKRRTALAVGSAAAGVAAATVAPELLLSPLAYVYYSDTDQNDYVAALLDKADDLEHGGPGSGRFPWGSGERPFQHRTPAGFMLPAHTGSYHQGHKSTRESKSSGSSNPSSSSSSSSSNTGASSQYDAYKAEEAQYKRNEERRKQQKHAADMADRARKIRKEDAKEKADKEKADKKEREDLEDAYWKEITNMTSQLASIRTHAKNLKAASKPVKDVTKKMSDQQLKELTDRLKLENSYLRELNTKQGYMAQPDKLDNFIGLMGDVTSMGRSASKVYRTANKQRKYL